VHLVFVTWLAIEGMRKQLFNSAPSSTREPPRKRKKREIREI